jgi:hypothetical protein
LSFHVSRGLIRELYSIHTWCARFIIEFRLSFTYQLFYCIVERCDAHDRNFVWFTYDDTFQPFMQVIEIYQTTGLTIGQASSMEMSKRDSVPSISWKHPMLEGIESRGSIHASLAVSGGARPQAARALARGVSQKLCQKLHCSVHCSYCSKKMARGVVRSWLHNCLQ